MTDNIREDRQIDNDIMHSLGRIEKGQEVLQNTLGEQKDRLDNHSNRIVNLEKFNSKILGMITVASTIAAGAITYFYNMK